MRRLDLEDGLVGVGLLCLVCAGALLHPALGLGVAGLCLLATGLGLARRER